MWLAQRLDVDDNEMNLDFPEGQHPLIMGLIIYIYILNNIKNIYIIINTYIYIIFSLVFCFCLFNDLSYVAVCYSQYVESCMFCFTGMIYLQQQNSRANASNFQRLFSMLMHFAHFWTSNLFHLHAQLHRCRSLSGSPIVISSSSSTIVVDQFRPSKPMWPDHNRGHVLTGKRKHQR